MQRTGIAPIPLLLLLPILFWPSLAAPTTEANYTVLDGLTANVTAASLTAWLAQWIAFPLASVTITNLSATRVTAQTCGYGTYSPADAQTCSACPPGTYSPALAATSSATCVKCPAGTYSGRAGATASSDCALCPPNTYFEGTGATSISNCSQCAGNSSSNQPYLRANCVCNPGFTGQGGEHPPAAGHDRTTSTDHLFFLFRRAMHAMQPGQLVYGRRQQPLPSPLYLTSSIILAQPVCLHPWLLWRPNRHCRPMSGDHFFLDSRSSLFSSFFFIFSRGTIHPFSF
jgi:hypothetical protein